jgi:hypothetical protein
MATKNPAFPRYVGFKVDERLLQAVARAAQEEERTVSQTIRRLLREALVRRELGHERAR